MLDWFMSMTLFEQILYGIAIISTGLFVLKGIFLIFGISSASDGLDVDDVDCADATGISYFSVIGILSFLAVGSWGAILSFSDSHLVSIIAGLFSGFVEMFATIQFIRFVRNMQESGNLKISLAIGKIGEVYLTIPPMELGEGKVNVVINGSLQECQAVSLDKTSIPTGTKVRIVDLQGDDVLVVQRESEIME